MTKSSFFIFLLVVSFPLKAELYQYDRDGNYYYTPESFCHSLIQARWGWTNTDGWTSQTAQTRENLYSCVLYTNSGSAITSTHVSMLCRDADGNNVPYDAASPHCAPQSSTRTRTASTGNAFDLSSVAVDFAQNLAFGLVIIAALAGLIVIRKAILVANRF